MTKNRLKEKIEQWLRSEYTITRGIPSEAGVYDAEPVISYDETLKDDIHCVERKIDGTWIRIKQLSPRWQTKSYPVFWTIIKD